MDKSKRTWLLLAGLVAGMWANAQQMSEREIQSQVRIATTNCKGAVDSGSLTAQISSLNTLVAKAPEHAELKKVLQFCSDELTKKLAQEDQLQAEAVSDFRRGAMDEARTKFTQLATRKTRHVVEAQRYLRSIPSGAVATAPAPASNQDFKDLDTAKSLLNVGDLAKAKTILERLVAKQGTLAPEAAALLDKIKEKERNLQLLQRAYAALNKGNYTEAQQLSQQIERSDSKFSQLANLQSQIARAMSTGVPAGAAPARPAEETKTAASTPEGAILNQSNIKINLGDLEGARVMLQDAEFQYPQSSAIRAQLQKVRDLQAQKQKTALAEQLVAEARTLITRHQYEVAQRRLYSAMQAAPDRTDIRPLLSQVNAAMLKAGKAAEPAAADLQEGIRGFYSGEFATARSKLDHYVKEKGKLTALAYFYLGATASAEYLLEGEKDRDKERQAGEYFAKVQQSKGRFEPPKDWISPRIMAMYDRASSRP